MVLTHIIKIPQGERYAMKEMTFTADTSEFPQIVDLSPRDKMLFLQSELIMQGLAFKVAVGYIKPESEEFKLAKEAAIALNPLRNGKSGKK